jgi:1,4-dihydroxy-2-naphthoyl-CoA hydrolase
MSDSNPPKEATPKALRWLAAFDESVAKRFLAMNDAGGGLPGYLGFRFTEFAPGRLRAEMPVRAELLTPFGNLHGGVLAAFCDHVLGCVCYPHMAPGQWAATAEFKLNYLAPVSEGLVEAEAEIVSMTRSTAVVKIEVRNGTRVACIAQGTVLIRDPR